MKLANEIGIPPEEIVLTQDVSNTGDLLSWLGSRAKQYQMPPGDGSDLPNTNSKGFVDLVSVFKNGAVIAFFPMKINQYFQQLYCGSLLYGLAPGQQVTPSTQAVRMSMGRRWRIFLKPTLTITGE